MDLEAILAEPSLRRCWLLNRALESAPFEDALKLARAAADFLDGGYSDLPSLQSTSNRPLVGAARTPATTEPARLTVPELLAGAGVVLPVGLGESLERGNPTVSGSKEEADLAAGNFDVASYEAETSHVETQCLDDATACEDADAVPCSSGTQIDLAVLASVDEVVRYLRQRDDVVVSDGPTGFLVNGRFHLNQVELFARANKMRQRQGKPEFQLIPFSFTTANGRAPARAATV